MRLGALGPLRRCPRDLIDRDLQYLGEAPDQQGPNVDNDARLDVARVALGEADSLRELSLADPEPPAGLSYEAPELVEVVRGGWHADS